MKRYYLLLVIAFFSIAAISLWFGGGVMKSPYCTLIGCFDRLSVSINGDIPSDYVMVVETPGHEPLTVHCVNGQDVEASRPSKAHCEPGGFTYWNSAPKWIKITFRWEGREITKKVRPDYENFRPNGPDCPPMCRVGRAEFTLRW
jgi:hypothetical protein